MFCEKCGMPIADDQRFCAACSAEESDAPNKQVDGFSLNCEGNSAPEKGGKGKWIALIAGAVAVIIVLVAVFWKPISGLFSSDKKFKSAQEQFHYVEGWNTASMANSISSAYGNMLAMLDTQFIGKEAEVKLTVNEEIMTLLSQLAEIDLQWLNEMSLNMKLSSDMSAMQMLMSLSLGQTMILDADIGMDYSEGKFWAGIPALTSTYLGIESDEMQMSMEQMDAFREELLGLMELLPDEQTLNKILNRYLDVVVSSIKNVESSAVTLSVGSVAQKCTALKVTLDAQTLNGIVVAVLETAQNDEELISIVGQIVEAYAPGAGDMFASGWSLAIQGLLDEFSSDQSTETVEPLIWIDYVDDNNQVIGREFVLPQAEDAVHYWTVRKGEQFAYEAQMDGLVITGNGTDSMGRINGEYVISVEGMDIFSVEIIDLDSILWDRGEICGTVRIRLTKDAMALIAGDSLPVDIALDVRIDTASAVNEICADFVLAEEVLVSVSVEIKDMEPFDILSPDNTIPADDETIEAWVSGFDLEKLRDNLLKAGLPMDYFADLDQVQQEAA